MTVKKKVGTIERWGLCDILDHVEHPFPFIQDREQVLPPWSSVDYSQEVWLEYMLIPRLANYQAPFLFPIFLTPNHKPTHYFSANPCNDLLKYTTGRIFLSLFLSLSSPVLFLFFFLSSFVSCFFLPFSYHCALLISLWQGCHSPIQSLAFTISINKYPFSFC